MQLKLRTRLLKKSLSSLNADLKFISPKFFYDKKGSELFEKICLLPEYYPTRTEISILKKLQNELSSFIDDSFRLVELGSGSSVKTRLILDVFSKLQTNPNIFQLIFLKFLQKVLSNYYKIILL